MLDNIKTEKGQFSTHSFIVNIRNYFIGTFVSSKRFEKFYLQMKEGDYLFIEFGHNDQKQTREGKGLYINYKNNLKFLVDKTRKKGGIPVLIPPMHHL